jgi:hypothetical protein
MIANISYSRSGNLSSIASGRMAAACVRAGECSGTRDTYSSYKGKSFKHLYLSVRADYTFLKTVLP